MRALTLWQPWAWLVANGHKLVENRPWAPSPNLLLPGHRFAIHAGKRFEVGAWGALLDVCDERGIVMPKKEELAYGAIIGTARFVATTRTADFLEEQRVWFAGPVAWILDDVRPLTEPVPAKGALGLWQVSPAISQLVLDREKKAA